MDTRGGINVELASLFIIPIFAFGHIINKRTTVLYLLLFAHPRNKSLKSLRNKHQTYHSNDNGKSLLA